MQRRTLARLAASLASAALLAAAALPAAAQTKTLKVVAHADVKILDPTFTTQLPLGSYVATEISGDANNAGQIFTFTPTVARYVRMNITSNYGSPTFTGMVEAAFEQSVPEPATPALLVTALTCAGLVRRQSRRI